ncbi:MAG: 6-phospho-3-hexuloisomerase [Lawsonibacter sp.]|nr:6-phospho-3-hexuloisomerase [Lawsonibacter sp.]
MDTKEYGLAITKELAAVMELVDSLEGERLCEAILSARRIFIAGVGRSGMAARGFAMRLMHLGLTTYVCGEVVTPSAGGGDLLLVVSGSGETGGLPIMAQKAKDMGASVALVTVRPDSTIGLLADAILRVPAPTPKAENSFRSIQPMGSLFEQSCYLILDALVMELMERLGTTEKAMFARHANLE